MANVLTTTLGTAGDVGSTAAELINVMEPQLLAVASYLTAPLESLFTVSAITGGKTMQWNRVERLNVATTPTAMTEGVTPESIGITINKVTATLEQYGQPVIITELAELTAKHNIVQGTLKTLGTQMGDTRHQLLYNVIDAASNTFRVNDRANDNAIQVGDTLDYHSLLRLRSALTTNGVPKFENGKFRFVSPSRQFSALLEDPDYKALNQFQNQTDIRNGYVGTIANVDVVESDHFSFAATASTTSGNSDAIQSGFIVGNDACGITALNAADKQLYIDPPGSGADYARQRYTLTWKMTFKSVRKNENFLRRFRASTIDAAAVA